MQNKKAIFQNYPWLPLLLLNLLLIAGTWLLFAIGLGTAISEEYHPDSVSHPLFPTTLALFIPSVLFLLMSLVGWFQWRRVTGKILGILLILYIVILSVSGAITYFHTDTNPDYRSYEHLGYNYVIPREYSPSKFWDDNLSIRVCGNSPLVGTYDRAARKGVIESCEQGTHVIEPLLQGYTESSGDIAKRELVNGKHGFTIATTADALVLASVDTDVLVEKKVQQIIEDDKVIFRSTDGGLHKTTFHLEFVDEELQWMTVCSLWDCRNYSRFPDNKDYVLRVGVYNRAQYERGFLTDEAVEGYKVLSDDVYELFKSFRISS